MKKWMRRRRIERLKNKIMTQILIDELRNQLKAVRLRERIEESCQYRDTQKS